MEKFSIFQLTENKKNRQKIRDPLPVEAFENSVKFIFEKEVIRLLFYLKLK